MELYLLEYLIAFKENNTLSKAAESLFVSEPTLSRAMQKLEKEIGHPLFTRSKNNIKLNEVGIKFSDYASHILEEIDISVNNIRQFAESLNTIVIESCAPAPIWQLLSEIQEKYPNKKVSYSIEETDKILNDLNTGICNIAIFPSDKFKTKHKLTKYMQEDLYITVKKNHPLAKMKEVSFKDINGYNFILYHQVGFWEKMCRDEMPQSKFIIQEDFSNIQSLVSDSDIPSFVTNITMKNYALPKDRVAIPISDAIAKVSFYIAYN